MKVIAVHNYYQNRGGEDQLFEDEIRLLESRGHEVVTYSVHSDSIRKRELLRVAINTLWNRSSFSQLTHLIENHSPDVIHFVNTFPLLSPSVFHAARKANVPTVATVQNYRYFCAQAMCFRDGKACQACLGKVPWRAVKHGCYHNSRIGSAVVATMQMIHRQMETWHENIDVLCVASKFSKDKLVSAGLPGQRMIIKPNFVPVDPGSQDGKGGNAIFVGRLAGEKGIQTLVDAWRQLREQGIRIPLKIVGDGPENGLVKTLVEENRCVQWLGHQANEDVYRSLGNAACLIFPSTGYESLPKTLIESLAVGTPIIGSDIGSIPEIVLENETGSLFTVGDPGKLAAVVKNFFAKPKKFQRMRNNCRRQFEERYTADINYRALIDIYKEAIRRREIAVAQSSSERHNPRKVSEEIDATSGISDVGPAAAKHT